MIRVWTIDLFWYQNSFYINKTKRCDSERNIMRLIFDCPPLPANTISQQTRFKANNTFFCKPFVHRNKKWHIISFLRKPDIMSKEDTRHGCAARGHTDGVPEPCQHTCRMISSLWSKGCPQSCSASSRPSGPTSPWCTWPLRKDDKQTPNII